MCAGHSPLYIRSSSSCPSKLQARLANFLRLRSCCETARNTGFQSVYTSSVVLRFCCYHDGAGCFCPLAQAYVFYLGSSQVLVTRSDQQKPFLDQRTYRSWPFSSGTRSREASKAEAQSDPALGSFCAHLAATYTSTAPW